MKKVELVVKNKATYLLLCVVPLALIWGGYKIYELCQVNPVSVLDVGMYGLITVMICAIAIYFFVRLNTYSHWMNPDHPKTKDEIK